MIKCGRTDQTFKDQTSKDQASTDRTFGGQPSKL
jgi:hypothetical protein